MKISKDAVAHDYLWWMGHFLMRFRMVSTVEGNYSYRGVEILGSCEVVESLPLSRGLVWK